jgi:hypothetical protein
LNLQDFDIDTARTLVGETFQIDLPSSPPLELRVTEVGEMSDEHARVKRTPFRIGLMGDRLVPQGTYPFRHAALGDAPLELFMVAVGKTKSGYEYEMIFT